MYLGQPNVALEPAGLPAKKENGWLHNNAANLVTTIRPLLTIVILYLLWFNPKRHYFLDNPANWWTFWDGLIMFFVSVIAGITDIIDGELARKWEIVSEFGMMYDKTVDKLLVVPVFAFIFRWMLWLWPTSHLGRFITIPFGIIGAIDTILFIGGIVLYLLKIRIGTSREGKLKMAGECISGGFWVLLILLIGISASNIWLIVFISIFLLPTLYYCLCSAYGYLLDAQKFVRIRLAW